MEILIAEGADVNAPNKFGNTPLQLAAIMDVNTVKTLINAEKVADGRVCETTLYWAVRNNYEKAVSALLEAGADVNIKNGEEGNTVLHAAVQNGHVGIVEILIANGADVNAPNKFGNTPLDLASEEVKKILQEGGESTRV